MKWWNRTLVVAAVGIGLWSLGERAEAAALQELARCRVTASSESEAESGGCGGGPGCSISLDCNNNGIDDRCDVSCLNVGQFCVSGSSLIDDCTRTSACGLKPDCNGNNKPDVCDLNNNDCNGNGVPDECETDCNGNGEPDDCDIAGGVSQDNNGNGIPDECDDCDGDGTPDEFETDPSEQDCDADGVCNGVEIAGCAGQPSCSDCNGNGIPDGCEVSGGFEFRASSDELPGLFFPQNLYHTITNAPNTVEAVTLTFKAVGDLDVGDPNAGPEFVRIYLRGCAAECGDCDGDWCFLGSVFRNQGEGSNCPATPDVDTLSVASTLYNAVLTVNVGDLEVRMRPNTNVGSECASSFIQVTVTHATADNCNSNGVPDVCETDCNNNGVPDDCDIADGTSQDCSGSYWAANGIPDECDIQDCLGGSPGCADCQNSGDPGSGVPDGCEADCNENLVPDDCDLRDCLGDPACDDCDSSGLPDECDISVDDGGFCEGSNCSSDCQPEGAPGHGVPDNCDIESGTSQDCQNVGEPGFGVPDECEPDCDGDGTPDFCALRDCPAGDVGCADCQPNSIPDSCDIADGTSEDCAVDPAGANGIPDDCEADCNGNLQADSCDIGSGESQDCDTSAVPDECETAVEVAGARYVEATPGGMTDDLLDANTVYKLLVFPEGLGCLEEYVQEDGSLGTNPAQHTPDEWCNRFIFSDIVIPDSSYTVVAEDPGAMLFIVGSTVTHLWGDADQDGMIGGLSGIYDIFCTLDAFRGQFSATCTLYSADLAPPIVSGQCSPPDQIINILDIIAAIDGSLNLLPYPCPNPCFNGNGSSQSSAATAVVEMSATSGPVDPGSMVDVDVYLSESSDVRSYQIAADVSGGSSGSMTLVDAFIDVNRPDYIFGSLTSYSAGDVSGARIANALESGSVNATVGVYLGTFRYQTSSNASGDFTVSVSTSDTLYLDSGNNTIGIASTTSVTITVELMNVSQK